MTVTVDPFGDERAVFDPATWVENVGLCAWNGWIYGRWFALTSDERQKIATPSKQKWKWLLARCTYNNEVRYSFDPAAPDYEGLAL